MILEHVILDIVAAQEPSFERAFEEATSIISSMAGFRSLRLDRCVERPSRYLLLVEWESIEDHVEGFRKSAEYERWRDLLHRFYEPFPVVEHFEPRVNM